LEREADRRLRVPEPQVTAGLKRADVPMPATPGPIANDTQSGLAITLSVPIPVFNNGRYEVARYAAEQAQANARLAVIARQIRGEIEGARDVLAIRRDALVTYQKEVEDAGSELSRITQVAYEEGEVGILELLDSLRLRRSAALRLLDLQAGVSEGWIEL